MVGHHVCGGAELEVGVNWAKSRAATNQQYCTKCASAYDAEKNAESMKKNAASPFAHLTNNQRGNFAEDFARAYYHELGMYTFIPSGDGCKVDFVVRNGDYKGIQVKLLSWSKGSLQCPCASTTGRVKYAAVGVTHWFFVHPCEPTAWVVPIDEARVTITRTDGTDNFPQYRVNLPMYFRQSYIEEKQNVE